MRQHVWPLWDATWSWLRPSTRTGLSSTLAASSHFCRWKSGGSPFKGETIDVVPSKDARPAVEYQNNVSEFTSSRRGALQKGEHKVTSPPDMPKFQAHHQQDATLSWEWGLCAGAYEKHWLTRGKQQVCDAVSTGQCRPAIPSREGLTAEYTLLARKGQRAAKHDSASLRLGLPAGHPGKEEVASEAG